MSFPIILYWNCQGARSRGFLKILLHLIKQFSPSIIILVETSVLSSYVHPILDKYVFNEFVVAEACGFAGGTWVLWNDSVMQVEQLTIDDQVINLVVKFGRDPFWFLSTIYASPIPNFQNALWKYLERVGTVVNLPWMLIGDFNQGLVGADKRGGSAISLHRVCPLRALIDNCEIIHMGFVIPRLHGLI